ncbi:MAG TPA: hypothetical protein VGE97_08655 [Nitrososphaera sp.]
MRLVDSSEGGDGGGEGRLEHTLERANYLIQCYGIHAFLADLDSGREYWRECNGSESIVHSALSWLTDEGFEKFFDQFELSWPHSTRLQWQQRYMIAMWKA